MSLGEGSDRTGKARPSRLRAPASLSTRLDEIEQEHAELLSIVERSRDAIWCWTLDGVIVRWNTQARDLLGYEPQEILGRSLTQLIPDDRREAAEAVIEGVANGRSYAQFETVRRHRDGTLIPVELSVSPVVAPDGTVTGAATLCRDIRQRRGFEAALGRRMAELATLVGLGERLQVAQELPEIYEAALDAIRDALGCERASILLFDARAVLQFVAWRGLSDAYRDAVAGHTPWTPDAKDVSPICIEDILESNEPEQLKATIAGEGIRGIAFIPLVSGGRLIGKFMCYYPQPHRHSEHEINLASTIARQLALAISRSLTEGELKESEARFRLMTEHAPVMIWMGDAEGRCLHLNGMLRRFWGLTEEAAVGFDWRGMLHPDDAAAVVGQMGEALAARRPITVRARFRDLTGRYRVLQTEARPRFSATGALLGMIGVNVDITDQVESERALRESADRFRLAIEASPSGMVMVDERGRIVLVNAQAERLFGYSRDELVGHPIERLVPDRFRPAHPAFRSSYTAEATIRAMGQGRDLFARRKDGSEIPVEIGLNPIETPAGLMTMAAIVDISARKRAEAQQELLVAELNHRVKNTLAVVQAIAQQTFRLGDAPPGLRAVFEGRLIALARAHNLLTESNWENASLHDLAAVALEAHGANATRVALSGAPVQLLPKQAIALSMALHELTTNAKKYGALSNASGRVHLEWRLEGAEPSVRIQWQEQGGPPVSAPTHRGFGSMLLERTLARDLGGRVDVAFNAAGLTCTILMPMTSGAEFG